MNNNEDTGLPVLQVVKDQYGEIVNYRMVFPDCWDFGSKVVDFSEVGLGNTSADAADIIDEGGVVNKVSLRFYATIEEVEEEV